MTYAAVDAAAPRATWLSGLARKDRAIVGPVADFVLMYGSPVLALALVAAFLVLPGAQTDVGYGATTTGLAFIVAAITFAHLAPVFVRSHLNPQIFSAHRLKLTIVPPLLLLALVTSHWAFVIAGVISVFWDVYHTAQQNFGLARIYDSKAGANPNAGRLLDRMMCHAMYIGPIMAGASFVEHLNSLGNLESIGFAAISALPQAAQGHAATIRAAAFTIIFAACAIYLFGQWRFARAGNPVSPHKVALMVCTSVVQVVTWGFCPPAIAFMIINLYHAVQYFGIVWRQEGTKAAAHLGVKSENFARPLAIALIFALPMLLGLAEALSKPAWNFITAFYLSVSLLHFWMDGFIWSVRKKTV